MGNGISAAGKPDCNVRMQDDMRAQSARHGQRLERRPESSNTEAHDTWLAQLHPGASVFGDTARNPALRRIDLDRVAKDESRRFSNDALYGKLFDDAPDFSNAGCVKAVLPLIKQAYAESPTFRRLFNHHVKTAGGNLYRLAAGAEYSTTVTDKQIEAANGHEMKFFADAEGMPRATDEAARGFSALHAMIHELVHALTGLCDDPSPDNLRGAVVEYTNIILADVCDELPCVEYVATDCSDNDCRPEGVGGKEMSELQRISRLAEDTTQGWRNDAMKSIDQLSVEESAALRISCPDFDRMRNNASPSYFRKVQDALAEIHSGPIAPSEGLLNAYGTFWAKGKAIETKWSLTKFTSDYLQTKINNGYEAAQGLMLCAFAGEQQQESVDARKRLRKVEEKIVINHTKDIYRQERDTRHRGYLQEQLEASSNPPIEDVPVVITTVYCDDTYEAEILSAPYGRGLVPSGAAKRPLSAPSGKGSAETATKDTASDPAPEKTQVVRVKAPVRSQRIVSETQLISPNLRGQIRSHQVKSYAGEDSSIKTHIGETWMLPGNVEASRKYIMETKRLNTSYALGSAPDRASTDVVYTLPKMPQTQRVEPSDARYTRPQAPRIPQMPQSLRTSQLSTLSQMPQMPKISLTPRTSRPAKSALDMSPLQAIKAAFLGAKTSTVVKRSLPFSPSISPSSSPPQSRSTAQLPSSPAHPSAVKRTREHTASPVLPSSPAVAAHVPTPPPPLVRTIAPEPASTSQQDNRLASLVKQLRGSTWDGDAIDLAVSLLVRLPGWPQDRILIIEDHAHALSNALLPPANPYFAQYGGACHGARIRQSLPGDMVDNAIRLQRVLLKGGVEHFDAIIDGRVQKVAPDGDCFFRAALAATAQKQPCNISHWDVMCLRNQSANYLQEHCAEFSDFFGETESPHGMCMQGMSPDAQISEKIKRRPTPLDTEHKKLNEKRTVAALQKWQNFTGEQRLEAGIDQFMMINKLQRAGDRNFFCLSGLMPRGQTYLNKLLGIVTIRIRPDHLIEWRDMSPMQRRGTTLMEFAERRKLNPSTCQRYMCRTGLTRRGVMFLAHPPKRKSPDITADILQDWRNRTIAERKQGGGVRGFAKEVGLNPATLKNSLSLMGVRCLPKKLEHLSRDGKAGGSQITYVKRPLRLSKKPVSKEAVSSDIRIPEKPTAVELATLTAACRTWESMTWDERMTMTIAGFVRENNLFGPNAREHFCLEGGGLKSRGQALLDKDEGRQHTVITLAVLQEWDEMSQEMRSDTTVVGFAMKHNLNPGSSTRYMGKTGLTEQGKSLLERLTASNAPDTPMLVLEWKGMSEKERADCGGVEGFAKQRKASDVVLKNYISGSGLRPRGENLLARRPGVPDTTAVRMVEHYAQVSSVLAATAAIAAVAIKEEPSEPMATIETLMSHTFDNHARYTGTLKPQSGKKLKIEMNRDLQKMLDDMPEIERLKIMASVRKQVIGWIRDEGDVAAARLDAMFEIVDPIDEGPARGQTVIAKQAFKPFEVIGCYAGEIVRFDDGSYERACREHGADNIAAYAFGVADKNALLSGYRNGNVLSKMNSVQPDLSMPLHPAWAAKKNNVRACSAGPDMVFFVVIEPIEPGTEVFLPYGESYKMVGHMPTLLKTENQDVQPEVGTDVAAGIDIADIDAYADTLEVMRIKGRKEKRGGKTLLAATELTFLRSFRSEEGPQFALSSQRRGWHLLAERPAGTELLPPRYRHLAPLISLSTQQRFAGQYYFYFARRDVYLPVTTTAISTEWRVQSPDGEDTVHILKYNGDLKAWRCGTVILT